MQHNFVYINKNYFVLYIVIHYYSTVFWMNQGPCDFMFIHKIVDKSIN